MKNIYIAFCMVLIVCATNAQTFNSLLGDTTVIELITFETATTYFKQSTPTTNCWEIGQPESTFFESALSESNAIITNTNGQYPANNHSWFDLIFPEYPFFDYLGISFYYKLNTEKSKDGGYITISYDSGKTWINIIEDNSGFFATSPATDYDYYTQTEGLYSLTDTLYNGEYGFSGKVSNWSKVKFNWVKYIAIKKKQFIDTVIVRFNFISDSANNMDGWMIDDIKLFMIDLPGAVNSSLTKSNLTISPNPIIDASLVSSKNGDKIMSYELFNICGQKMYVENINSKEFTIKKHNLKPGIYYLRCEFSDKNQASIKIIIE